MRIFGTISGKIRNQGIETYYREGEESEKWKNYEIEIVDVKIKDSAETYPSLWLHFGYKGKLCFEDAEIPGNKIAFDATKIENDIVKGIRNVCGTLTRPWKPISVAEREKKQVETDIALTVNIAAVIVLNIRPTPLSYKLILIQGGFNERLRKDETD